MELFKFNKVCEHSKVRPEVDFAYCPDCGELIENRWFLIRCACCGVKLRGVIKNGKIIPSEHFCHNCGAGDFVVERISKINFIDINYAVLVKSIVQGGAADKFTQSWVETDFRTSNYRPRLLPEY